MAKPHHVRQSSAISSAAQSAIASGKKALDQSRFEDAARAFRKAASLAPEHGALHYALGVALTRAERAAEAIDPLRRARDMSPQEFDWQLALADAYYLAGQHAHALPEYLRAGALRPESAVAWSNAGALFREAGRPELALSALQRALTVDPANSSALCNSALALHDIGEFAAAQDYVEKALVARPDYPEAKWNRALLDLLHGNFTRGWEGHEFRTVQLAKLGGLRTFPEPRWNGERFDGKRLLLWPEQGMGDQLQFSRFIPRVKALGGTVIIGCSSGLVPLFKANFPDADEVVVVGEPFAPVDLQLPLMSIPRVLGLGDSLDAECVPYLRADGSASEQLSGALPILPASAKQALRVGIAWAGQPKHLNDRNRSLTLETLRPLVEVGGVEWYSLQKGDAAEAQLAPFNALSLSQSLPPVTPLGPLFSDFNDTAHAVSRLDVVITVDTSVAHLAGAMGAPVWLMIPFVPDWRWQVNRKDSPWYPSARLFRQEHAGEWNTVISQMAKELSVMVQVASQRSSVAGSNSGLSARSQAA